MRTVLYICILASLLFAPVERLDVAQLQPVQTVAVAADDKAVTIETDTGSKGEGETLREAVEDLEQNTPGVIYLDTAQYLLLTEATESYAAQLLEFMEAKVRVSLWDGKGSVKEAAKYLDVRKDLPRLKDLVAGK